MTRANRAVWWRFRGLRHASMHGGSTVRHGAFRIDQPFATFAECDRLPHNSASAIAATGPMGFNHAIAGIKRALAGETPINLVPWRPDGVATLPRAPAVTPKQPPQASSASMPARRFIGDRPFTSTYAVDDRRTVSAWCSTMIMATARAGASASFTSCTTVGCQTLEQFSSRIKRLGTVSARAIASIAVPRPRDFRSRVAGFQFREQLKISSNEAPPDDAASRRFSITGLRQPTSFRHDKMPTRLISGLARA